MNPQGWSFVDTKSESEWAQFCMEHEIAHQTIAEQIAINSAIAIDHIPLSDADKAKMDWLLSHQTIHFQIYNATSMTTGLPDLASVDFNDDAQSVNWMLLHSQVHQDIMTTLGL